MLSAAAAVVVDLAENEVGSPCMAKAKQINSAMDVDMAMELDDSADEEDVVHLDGGKDHDGTRNDTEELTAENNDMITAPVEEGTDPPRFHNPISVPSQEDDLGHDFQLAQDLRYPTDPSIR